MISSIERRTRARSLSLSLSCKEVSFSISQSRNENRRQRQSTYRCVRESCFAFRGSSSLFRFSQPGNRLRRGLSRSRRFGRFDGLRSTTRQISLLDRHRTRMYRSWELGTTILQKIDGDKIRASLCNRERSLRVKSIFGTGTTTRPVARP